MAPNGPYENEQKRHMALVARESIARATRFPRQHEENVIFFGQILHGEIRIARSPGYVFALLARLPHTTERAQPGTPRIAPEHKRKICVLSGVVSVSAAYRGRLVFFRSHSSQVKFVRHSRVRVPRSSLRFRFGLNVYMFSKACCRSVGVKIYVSAGKQSGCWNIQTRE